MVITNSHRNTGIVLCEFERTVQVILMDEGPLDVKEITRRELWKNFFPMKDYPDSKAAAHYLKHSAGVTLRARRELKRLCGEDTSQDAIVHGDVEPVKVSSRGGVRDKVWQVADDMWEKAGKPTDKKVVLALRKSMMEVLLKDFEVKITTSSNELGNWMKARLA